MKKNKKILILLLHFAVVPLFAQENDTVTLPVDDVPQKTAEEIAKIESERQDSITKSHNEFYNEFLELKILEIQKIHALVKQIDTTKSIAEIEEELDSCNTKLETQENIVKDIIRNWISNVGSNKVAYEKFQSECSNTQNRIQKVQKWIEEKKAKQPKETNWLAIAGIVAGILVMGGIPIFMQLMSRRAIKKQQKMQQKQQDEMLRLQ
ncbi:MAG: hypothetical protein LBS28_01175, partial [Streptococcaceae bacterium]|nr:hypothetical protein [Streptococcaceae bacterium]